MRRSAGSLAPDEPDRPIRVSIDEEFWDEADDFEEALLRQMIRAGYINRQTPGGG
ncbi:hypothetical protein [Microbacterium marmarense]|uniref:Uncharacterized protein n=1 Tax=Microbacterium marmarense TaxID=3122051 RepID=A0ABU8LTR6_9MICO